jgi:hypothetical protein
VDAKQFPGQRAPQPISPLDDAFALKNQLLNMQYQNPPINLSNLNPQQMHKALQQFYNLQKKKINESGQQQMTDITLKNMALKQ